uniref:Uncharacterized protein n=1 Tax=Davidia involucrata TaxID=16924 RepID=A0A5B6ZY06_DAVIN
MIQTTFDSVQVIATPNISAELCNKLGLMLVLGRVTWMVEFCVGLAEELGLIGSVLTRLTKFRGYALLLKALQKKKSFKRSLSSVIIYTYTTLSVIHLQNWHFRHHQPAEDEATAIISCHCCGHAISKCRRDPTNNTKVNRSGSSLRSSFQIFRNLR